jgi:hypothetical protein
MENLVSYLTIENVVLFVVAIVLFVGVGLLIKKVFSNKKEKKRKENPFILGVEHDGRLFKMLKLEEEKGIAFLSFDPNANFPSGKGGEWFVCLNIPKELRRERQVLEVIKVDKKEIKIVGHLSF